MGNMPHANLPAHGKLMRKSSTVVYWRKIDLPISFSGSHETDMFGCYFYRIEPDWGFCDAIQEPFYGEQRSFGPVFQVVWLTCAELCYVFKIRPENRERHSSMVC